MTVVDSSVWIDYFNGIKNRETDQLDLLLAGDVIVVGDLILAEVLQGFRSDQDFSDALAALTSLELVSMGGPGLAISAAQNYRTLRRLGVTVRKTIDVLIATWCIEFGQPLLYSDRDFDPCVEHLGLPTVDT